MRAYAAWTFYIIALEILDLSTYGGGDSGESDDGASNKSSAGGASRLVAACLTRIEPASGLPPLWQLLFGKSGTSSKDDAPVYDKDMLEKSHWTTNDWIERHKYALEVHNVTTADGYELQLQRLPRHGGRPILLVHGLFTSSLSWVLRGPTKSLAFLLHDRQYDVWLANLRGSAYGRNHTRLNATTDADYWSYSYHEHGVYDLPAIIEHIRNESSYHQVMLISHSQGFNAVLVLCAVHPEYNERVLFLQALAPTAMLRDYATYDNEDVRRVKKLIKSKTQAQSYEVFPAGFLRQRCLHGDAEQRKECASYMRTFAGRALYPKSLQPLVYGQLLQGGSLKELTHLLQLWKSGDFVAYDYDPDGNRAYYNSVEPYNYDLRRVTVPMVLHFGATDASATPDGVHQIYAQLLTTVIGVYRVAAPKFNHFDFLCADDAMKLVNDKLLDVMQQYFDGTLKYVIE